MPFDCFLKFGFDMTQVPGKGFDHRIPQLPFSQEGAHMPTERSDFSAALKQFVFLFFSRMLRFNRTSKTQVLLAFRRCLKPINGEFRASPGKPYFANAEVVSYSDETPDSTDDALAVRTPSGLNSGSGFR